MEPTRNAKSLTRVLLAEDEADADKRKRGRFTTQGVGCEFGRALNISSTGMKVLGAGKVTVKAKDQVSLILSNAHYHLPIEAEVVWVKTIDSKQFEIGLHFTNVTADMANGIRQIAMATSPSLLMADS